MPSSIAPFFRGLASAKVRTVAEPVSKARVVSLVLDLLSRDRAMAMSEIAAAVPSVPVPELSDIVRQLVDSGICEALPMPRDEVAVRLTDRGWKLAS